MSRLLMVTLFMHRVLVYFWHSRGQVTTGLTNLKSKFLSISEANTTPFQREKAIKSD